MDAGRGAPHDLPLDSAPPLSFSSGMNEPNHASEPHNPSTVISHDPPFVQRLMPPQKPKKGPDKWTIALVIACAAAVIGWFVMGAMHQSAAPPPSEYEVDVAQYVNIDDLCAAYRTNEVGADQAYRQKRIRVIGEIEAISRAAFSDAPHLYIAGSQKGCKVSAFFEESAAHAVGKTRVGERATAECVCAGLSLGTPVLKKCTMPY